VAKVTVETMFYRIIRYIAYLFFKILFRLEVKNQDYIPEEGGVIIASNHSSYLDPPLIAVSLKRRPTFIAKSSLHRIPLLGPMIKAYSISVNRDMPGPSTIKDALKVLKNGGVLVIFPEGGRSADGSLMEFKRGVGLIASLADVPVVPVYIRGAGEALPVGARFPRLKKISIIFGRPLQKRSEENREVFEKRITQEIFERIKSLMVGGEGNSSLPPLTIGGGIKGE